MKKYWKIIAGCIGFSILMAGSVILYNKLSREYEPEQNLETDGLNGEENRDAGDGNNREKAGSEQSGTENGQHGTDRRHRRDKPENIRRYSPAGYIRSRRPVLRGQS